MLQMYKLFNYSQVFLTLFIFFVKSALKFPLPERHHALSKFWLPVQGLSDGVSEFLH